MPSTSDYDESIRQPTSKIIGPVALIRRERLNVSVNGNPRFRVTVMQPNGNEYEYETKSDAAVNYDVDNWFSRGARADRSAVYVVLQRNRVVDIYSMTGDRKAYP